MILLLKNKHESDESEHHGDAYLNNYIITIDIIMRNFILNIHGLLSSNITNMDSTFLPIKAAIPEIHR